MSEKNSNAQDVGNEPVTPVASIIVPIRITWRSKESLIRLERLLQTIPPMYEIVVVDDGSRGRPAEKMRQLCIRYGCHYDHLATRRETFSLSRTRNHGAKIAKTAVVIFHDLDFITCTASYKKIADEIVLRDVKNDPSAFFCLPVAFLTKQGSQAYLDEYKTGEVGGFWGFQKHPNKPSDSVQFIVNGSSCIVINREYLLSIGGHDESYIGHGAEDFELLHRMSHDFPIAEKPIDYSVNTKSRIVTE
jgi:predicted glycosyltransferase involved in capsule biosynthesis